MSMKSIGRGVLLEWSAELNKWSHDQSDYLQGDVFRLYTKLGHLLNAE